MDVHVHVHIKYALDSLNTPCPVRVVWTAVRSMQCSCAADAPTYQKACKQTGIAQDPGRADSKTGDGRLLGLDAMSRSSAHSSVFRDPEP